MDLIDVESPHENWFVDIENRLYDLENRNSGLSIDDLEQTPIDFTSEWEITDATDLSQEQTEEEIIDV